MNSGIRIANFQGVIAELQIALSSDNSRRGTNTENKRNQLLLYFVKYAIAILQSFRGNTAVDHFSLYMILSPSSFFSLSIPFSYIRYSNMIG